MMSSVLASGEARCEAHEVAARAARQFLRDELEMLPLPESPLENTILLASELVTNGVLHARTDLTLRYEVQPACVRIEVEDGNSRHPTAALVPTDATSGRGLALVQALAEKWGVDGTEDGKVVWFELPLDTD